MAPSKRLKKILESIGISTILLAGTSFYISYRLLHPQRRKQEQTPKNFGLKYKDVEFKSEDGTLLKGYLVKAKNTKGLIILSHGYSYDKQSMLPAAKELYKHDYSSLLFDYRAHGESGGHKTTIGFLEQEDLISAIDFAKHFSKKIGVFGISMGAATSIFVGEKTTGLTCIISDSSFADLKEAIYHKLPVLRDIIVKFMEFQGVNFKKTKPISVANKIPIPIFFIHGDKDALIPFQDSVKLYNKVKAPKKLWIVKGGQHGRAYFVDKGKYSKKIAGFLDKYFLV